MENQVALSNMESLRDSKQGVQATSNVLWTPCSQDPGPKSAYTCPKVDLSTPLRFGRDDITSHSSRIPFFCEGVTESLSNNEANGREFKPDIFTPMLQGLHEGGQVGLFLVGQLQFEH